MEKQRENVSEQKQHGGYGQEMDINKKLIINMRDLNHVMRSLYEGKASQQRILIILNETGSITQRDLTMRLGIQPGSASEILAKLENAGFILRTSSEADRRTANISLTELGKQMAASAAEQRSRRHVEMFACLSESEKTDLLALLEKVNEDWTHRYRTAAEEGRGRHHRHGCECRHEGGHGGRGCHRHEDGDGHGHGHSHEDREDCGHGHGRWDGEGFRHGHEEGHEDRGGRGHGNWNGEGGRGCHRHEDGDGHGHGHGHEDREGRADWHDHGPAGLPNQEGHGRRCDHECARGEECRHGHQCRRNHSGGHKPASGQERHPAETEETAHGQVY